MNGLNYSVIEPGNTGNLTATAASAVKTQLKTDDFDVN